MHTVRLIHSCYLHLATSAKISVGLHAILQAVLTPTHTMDIAVYHRNTQPIAFSRVEMSNNAISIAENTPQLRVT